MAGSKISNLNAASSVSASDLLAIVDVVQSETKKVTADILGKALTQFGISVGTTAPSSPYNGQPWCDTTTNPPVLKVWNGASWTIWSISPTQVVTSPAATAPSTPGLGVLWQDTSQTPDQLKMWDGSNWVRVDPQGITQTAADARYLQPATAASTYMPLSGGTFTGAVTLAGAPSTNLQPATKLYVDSAVSGIVVPLGVPAGTIIWTARNTAPTGYLKANGAAVSRATYSDLFTAIGTTFGAGDGSTTFNLPDLRGEFIRGWDDGRGIDSGRSFASGQTDEFESHSHVYGFAQGSNAAINNGYAGISGVVGTGNVAELEQSGGADGQRLAAFYAKSAVTGSTETRPRNVALLACIKS